MSSVEIISVHIRPFPTSNLRTHSFLLFVRFAYCLLPFVKLGGRESFMQILHRCRITIYFYRDIILDIIVCLFSAMDFCFGLIAIFLILDVASVQSTDNGCSKKKMYSNKVRLSKQSSSINPFLQMSTNRPNIQDNSFNPLNNKNKNPISTAQAFNIAFSNNNYNPFPKSKRNPFLNYIRTNSRDESPNSLITQTPYTSLPYYQISAPITVPNIPVFNTPAPENDLTYIPPKIHPLISRSLLEEPIEINRVKTISEHKCEEYAKEIAGTSLITFLTGSSSDVREVIHTCESENPLVINGTEAKVGEFPHMVALGICKDMQNCSFDLKCGGALISPIWVLSAAHCSHGPNGGPTVARIGFHNLTEQKGVLIAIEDMIRHPDYQPPNMYADIALVKLANTVTFDKLIRPACLYQQNDTVIKEAWISGWGITKNHAGKYSNPLLKAKLDLIDNQNCTEKYKDSTTVPRGITSNMICAGDLHGNWITDACKGDSGGPLQIIDPNKCLFQVIGITSIGKGCAMSDTPSVYTKVSYYLSWIEDKVWPQE